MEHLHPFISFSGNCEEAMNYYKNKLGGEILALMHFDEGPMEIPSECKKNVMFCELKFGNCTILASDKMPGTELTVGDNIALSIRTSNLEITEKWFKTLSEEGFVKMPLQDTFWGARFGMLTDKFGINWMFNCEQEK